MSSFFILQNFHFALEILGALAFLGVAWLAVDSLLVRQDWRAISRAMGFGLLVCAQILHAFDFSSEIIGYAEYIAYIGGILFVIFNFIAESPAKRPEFKAVLVIPSLASLFVLFQGLTTGGLALIAALAYRQYRLEQKKALIPFALAFLFFAIGSATAFIPASTQLGAVWMAEHAFRLVGFMMLGTWVWQYLQLRIREELLLIFVSVILFMATIVTLTFSTILVGRMEAQTQQNLLTNAKVFHYAIQRLEQEAYAKAQVLAHDRGMIQALAQKDFATLDTFAVEAAAREKLGLLTIADASGGVLVRGHGLTQRGDTIAGERAVQSALRGVPFVTIESHSPEGLAIRATAPVYEGEVLIGVIVGGMPLDNAMVDGIKKITGLEMSVFEQNTRVATTLFNLDGRTRSVGIHQTDPRVSEAVLERENALTLATDILSRPFLASFIPLADADNKIVGMLSAAQPQQEIADVASATNRLTLITVMGIMLILILPIYILTKRLAEEAGTTQIR